jgi:hypothetical protein
MVWKSNLNEQDQELIEDLGGVNTTSVPNAPGLTGGITSNKKPKAAPVATQQISAPSGKASSQRYPGLSKAQPNIQSGKIA